MMIEGPTHLTSVGSTSDVKKNATDNAPPIATFPSTAKPIRLASERMGLVDWSVFDTSRLHTRKHPPNISKREMANLRPCMFAIYTLEKVAGISNIKDRIKFTVLFPPMLSPRVYVTPKYVKHNENL
jgi:hypothetical protein